MDGNLELLKGEVKHILGGIKLVKDCVVAAQNGNLKNQNGVQAIKLLVQSLNNLCKYSSPYLDKGTPEAKRLSAFIHNAFKLSIIQVGNSLKVLLKTNDYHTLGKHIQELVVNVKHLMKLLAENSSMAVPLPVANSERLSRISKRVRESRREGRGVSVAKNKVRSSRIADTTQLQQKEMEKINRVTSSTYGTTSTPPPVSTPAPAPAPVATPSPKPVMSLPKSVEEIEEYSEQSEAEIAFEEQSLVGCCSDPGDRYGDINQDYFMYCPSGEGFVVAIFDGHGPNGEVASKTASKTFEAFFSKVDLFSVTPKRKEELIKQVFAQAHKNILEEYTKEALRTVTWGGAPFHLTQDAGLTVYANRKYGMLLQDFGTTAVMAAVKVVGGVATDLIIAHTGDSTAIIGRKTEDEILPIENICVLHNGVNEREVQRLAAFGSTIVDDHYISAPASSGFSWAQIAVSRSLGHKYFQKYGISPEPAISDYKLHRQDKYLVLCSDGVTDVLTGDEIVEVVAWSDHYYEGKMDKIAAELVQYSLKNWEDEADNTTAIVVKLKFN
eukprot:TRINITY_DN4938_c0_g1_i1.p1 TRINITY_DN4938_c0_g1~~TRINITY_DN4938_c0_g1_i1.p1  ORF type:complete len:553 (-),score=127.41 TRINITY_DN4938_c0_g1_i1:7-1665(-)